MSISTKGPTRHELRAELVEEILRRTSGRSRLVVKQILDHGFVTTTTLGSLNLDHPPRAAADVRDRGIPLLTVTKSVDGKQVGHYRFPDKLTELDRNSSGRFAISKKFQKMVIDHYGDHDIFTGMKLARSSLQIDHRVPFRISGDPTSPFDIKDFMPVSAAMNRAKSWECEACPNWNERSQATCESCYWAVPDQNYEHVATVPVRRLDLVWQADEVHEFERLLNYSKTIDDKITSVAKHVIAEALQTGRKSLRG